MRSSVLILLFFSGLAAASSTTSAATTASGVVPPTLPPATTPGATTPAPGTTPTTASGGVTPTLPLQPATTATSTVTRTPPPQFEKWSYNMSKAGTCDPTKPVLCAPPDWGLIQGSDCGNGSKQQSPIDFKSNNYIRSADYGMMDLNFTQLPCNQAKFFQDKHTNYVGADVGNCDGSFHIKFKGYRYKLISFKWRSPSEHRVDGKSYPMELQMKHKRYGANTPTDDIIMLGMWISVGPNTTGFTKQMTKHVPFHHWHPSSVDDRSSVGTKAVNLTGKFSPYDFFLPTLYAEGSYLAYNGSFTAPMCRSPVLWLFLSKPVMTDQASLDAYRTSLGNIPQGGQLNFNQPEPLWAGDAWGNGPSPWGNVAIPTVLPFQHPNQQIRRLNASMQAFGATPSPSAHQPGWDLSIGCNNRPPQAGHASTKVYMARGFPTSTTTTTTTWVTSTTDHPTPFVVPLTTTITTTTTTTVKAGICSGKNMWFCILLPLLFCCCIPLAALLAFCCCPKAKTKAVKRSVPVPVAVPEPAPVAVEPEVVEPLILPAQGKWVQPYKNIPVTTQPPVTTKTTYEKAYEEVIYEPVTAYRAVGAREVAAPVAEVMAAQQFPITEVVATQQYPITEVVGTTPFVTTAQQYTGGSVSSFASPRVGGVAPSYTYR